ncbi:Low temperature requirement A [Hirsutella rhossiliensis]|uniref:Low temperature requirement A n=1 Tax=Hirsutella rhossiliensis TaxID=111463 RepID=A0A9P8SMD4_9HYPO|nr:Low temperature requirement A [Hirsutella rhossiliensis]KAH0967891.1 Low temperature requirement A [Hirsutella rhossiliensis]
MSDHDTKMQPGGKLRLFTSPLVYHGDDEARSLDRVITDSDGDSDGDSDKGGRRPPRDLPRLVRREEPSLLEVFFDLFFAANYNVFSDNQEVTNHARFKAYIGFFFLLWVTWLVVTLFDVRYVTDSIFSRLTRAIQLGVMVGFTVVAPKFNPTDQDKETMQAMSLILFFSRACLAIEYGATLWHVRRFEKARIPLYIQIAVHTVAAIIYFGITFGFKEDRNSRIFISWYFVSGAEAIITIAISNFYAILNFTKTHIMKRLTLLTVIIIGDGIIQVAREVVTIVKHPDAWDKATIGLVTAATATIYFIFLVYFDWLRSSFYLPPLRQQLWIGIHLPFHLSLILFTQGFTQFLLWSKIIDVLNKLSSGLSRANSDWLFNATSKQVQGSLNKSAQVFFLDFPPRIASTQDTVNNALANISQIPDSFWPDLANYYRTDDTAALQDTDLQSYDVFSNALQAAMSSMANALFATFGVGLESEVTTKNLQVGQDIEGSGFQGQVQDKTLERYKLVFAYTYVAGGCTLFFMMFLAIIARTTPLKPWPIIRLTIIFLLALGTSLTALLFYSPQKAFDFLQTLWVLPVITFVWAIVLVVTHINGGNVGHHVRHFRRRGRPSASDYVPPTPAGGWTNDTRRTGKEQQGMDVNS